MNPWDLELIVVHLGSRQATERQSLARDVGRRLLTRVRRGVYVERTAWEGAAEADRHLIRMRAYAAVASERPTFSHWSAAAAFGLPFLGPQHLARVHTVVRDAGARGQDGVFGHVAPVFPGELVELNGLLFTSTARTAVDIARARPLVEGIVVADAALRAGIPREALERSVDLAEALRGVARAADAVAFARAESGSILESISRHSHMVIGIPPLELQHEIRDRDGLAGVLDFYDERTNSGGEADGEDKYLTLAEQGAAKAVIAEKWREDRVRAHLHRLARWGWAVGRDPLRLEPVLARAGIVASHPRATLSDYCRPHARRTSH